LAAFLTWISTYGSIIGFFVQVVFYITVAISAAWAATTFSRYVKYMVSDDDEVEEISEDESADETSDDVPIDEFVE
jgi:hypothetical protein